MSKRPRSAKPAPSFRSGDGIATVYGLENVMYGELLEFENGVRALAMNLETGQRGLRPAGPGGGH